MPLNPFADNIKKTSRNALLSMYHIYCIVLKIGTQTKFAHKLRNNKKYCKYERH
jgi:hypothetical protein